VNEAFLAAVVQMNSGEDKHVNLAAAVELIREAAAQGASLVVLPEMFLCLGRASTMVAAGESIDGPTVRELSDLARNLSITLIAGSLPETIGGEHRVYNTSVAIGDDGAVLGHYRKLHLFDVDLADGTSHRESAWSAPGDAVSVIDTRCGRIGQSICYDLRFPELYRAITQRNAELLAVPAAFTATTGREHWEVLLRARAIENQSYVLAANQCGAHTRALVTYGHSMIVDPWGRVLTALAEGVGVAMARIDLADLRATRARMPALAHRRL
jgi:predicted amidohydrolase